jgi:hypothetical protein
VARVKQWEVRTLEALRVWGQIRDNMARDVCVQGLWGFLWWPDAQPCMYCEEPCSWIDLGFEGRLHPGPCADAMWDAYSRAQVFPSPVPEDFPG